VATPSQNGNEKDGQTHLDKIIALFRHLGSLDSQIDLEHSFKTVDDQLLTNRFLLGIRRHDVQTRFDESIASVCERIGMPERLQASFKQTLSDANHVYFGVEKNAESLVVIADVQARLIAAAVVPV
jgi:hypothetical protein